MNEQTFVRRRETGWKRLALLCAKAESRPKTLTPEELRDLVRLYRRVSTDLAIARTGGTNIQVVDSLNDLATRAYSVLYSAPRRPFFKSIGHAVLLSADTVRRNKAFVFASIAIFVGSILFSFFVSKISPDVRDVLLPAQIRPLFDEWKSGSYPHSNSSTSVMMAGMYASHNPLVAIIAGAVSAGTFGILTAFMLFQNGAILGSLLDYVQPAGKMGFVLTSIMPHGVTELSGIIMAGASGFRLGWALINPGRFRRGQALREAGKDAIVLLCTAVVLMFIAAPIEGFFSFNAAVPGGLKIAFAAVSLTAWLIFWTRYGRVETTQ